MRRARERFESPPPEGLEGEDLEKHLRGKRKKLSNIESRSSFDLEVNMKAIQDAENALHQAEKYLDQIRIAEELASPEGQARVKAEREAKALSARKAREKAERESLRLARSELDKGGLWQQGGLSRPHFEQSPHKLNQKSSFEVLDRILETFFKNEVYSALEDIVIVGSGIGAQACMLYAGCNPVDKTTIKTERRPGNPRVRYVPVASPSFLYLSHHRPSVVPNPDYGADQNWWRRSHKDVTEGGFYKPGNPPPGYNVYPYGLEA